MCIENNPLRLIKIDDFYGKLLKELEIKIKDVRGAYIGKSFILTTSDKSYEQVFEKIGEVLSDTEDKEEWMEEIKNYSIKNIKNYVDCMYEQEYYDDECMANESENVMETIVFAFNEGRLLDEELSDWQGLIDKTVKQHVMEYVSDEVVNKVRKLKADGYDISELISSLDKLK